MFLLFVLLAIICAGVLVSNARRTTMLESRLDWALDRLDRLEQPRRAEIQSAAEALAEHVAAAPAKPLSALSVAHVRTTVEAVTIISPDAEAPTSPPPPRPNPEPVAAPVETPHVAAPPLAERIEALIGGKLPIWVGGIALVLAGFYLVRYSIEAGLLGPGVRVIIAALFGMALLVASEAVRFVPRIRSDRRIGQALAGAGIASLYGTLYMASELYALIGAPVAFALLVITTIIALGLSLRQGPPTAIMGLIGGFAAPYLAGLGENQVVPLLIYLALLMAGLFALSVHRGWLWLALATSGGGALWSIALLISGRVGDGAATGLFVVLMAVAATFVLPRAAPTPLPLRLAPLFAGLVQLAIFAPMLEFSAISWGLYALLSVASLILAWRDPQLTPGAGAALALVVALLIGGFVQETPLAPLAALIATLLFALPGHALARRAKDGEWWSLIALGGGTAPLLVAMQFAPALLDDQRWAALALLAALPPASLAWRVRAAAREILPPDLTLAAATVTAALMALVGQYWGVTQPWHAAAVLGVATALAAWSARSRDAFVQLVMLGVAALGALIWLVTLVDTPPLVESVFGAAGQPGAVPIIALLVAPALLLALSWWMVRTRIAAPVFHWASLALGVATALALVPAPWHPAMLALIAVGLLLATPRLPLPRFGIEAGFAALAIGLLAPLSPFAAILLESLVGMRLHFAQLPLLPMLALKLGVPLALVAGAAWQFRDRISGPFATAMRAAIGLLLLAIGYWLAKQPLAIADDARFADWGLIERALLTQALFACGWFGLARGWQRAGGITLAIALARFVWFDLLLLNPVLVHQAVGALPVVNAVVIHAALVAFWMWRCAPLVMLPRATRALEFASLGAQLLLVLVAVRQAFAGNFLDSAAISLGETYGYSAGLLLLALAWLVAGMRLAIGWLRLAGLALLTLVTLKVFLIDASALEGLLRVVSFLGLGGALLAIGWAYGRLLGRNDAR